MSVLIKWDGFWTGGGEGELHIDIPTFVQRQTQVKIKQLVKSVLKSVKRKLKERQKNGKRLSRKKTKVGSQRVIRNLERLKDTNYSLN